MARWRAARDAGTTLSSQEEAELEALVEAEMRAAADRARALLQGLAAHANPLAELDPQDIPGQRIADDPYPEKDQHRTAGLRDGLRPQHLEDIRHNP